MKQKWFGAKYIGGHSEFQQKMGGHITLTNDSFVFQSAKWHLVIPYEKIREVSVKTTKEITAFRTLLLKPLLASLFKKKREFLLIGYEDELGLKQNLVFDTRHKRDIIYGVRSSLAELQQKRIVLLPLMKCPQCGETYSSKKGFDFCPTCGVKLESA